MASTARSRPSDTRLVPVDLSHYTPGRQAHPTRDACGKQPDHCAPGRGNARHGACRQQQRAAAATGEAGECGAGFAGMETATQALLSKATHVSRVCRCAHGALARHAPRTAAHAAAHRQQAHGSGHVRLPVQRVSAALHAARGRHPQVHRGQARCVLRVRRRQLQLGDSCCARQGSDLRAHAAGTSRGPGARLCVAVRMQRRAGSVWHAQQQWLAAAQAGVLFVLHACPLCVAHVVVGR
jgi:hypothetical protein